jgi:hypothetical protein
MWLLYRHKRDQGEGNGKEKHEISIPLPEFRLLYNANKIKKQETKKKMPWRYLNRRALLAEKC